MKKDTVFYTLGLLLIAAALVLTMYNLRQDKQAGEAALSALEQFPSVVPSQPAPSEAAETLPEYAAAPLIPMPVQIVNGLEYVGKLAFPTLELTLPVLNTWSYDHLNIAPCCFTGSLYQKNMVICGHNFASHFGRLRDLRLGDAVQFTDMDGNVFSLCVEEITVLPSTALHEMTESAWALTLFTCDLNRSNRVAVRCSIVQ